MKLKSEDILKIVQSTITRYKEFCKEPLTKEDIEYFKNYGIAPIDVYIAQPLTEEEKTAFTLYNFVYLEENLIRKNSDKITELTISIYNCLGYFRKCLFLYSYIKLQIIDDKAKYIRNNNLKINIKNCDNSEDKKKLLREMGEILFTLRNCIVHNHFEVENGILKIDSNTKEYTFQINIPVSLLHYMIIPVLELRMEAGEIHACGYDDRLCYEMHRRQIPFTSVENSSLYQRKLLSKNDEEEILKLDQSFSEKDLTIWGAMEELYLIEDYELKEKVLPFHVGNVTEIEYYLQRLINFYQGIAFEKKQAELSYSIDGLKIPEETPDGMKKCVDNIEKNIDECIKHIKEIQNNVEIPENRKAKIITDAISKFKDKTKKKIHTILEECNRMQNNISKHMNEEYSDDFIISGDRKDNNILPKTFFIEKHSKYFNKKQTELDNKSYSENELLLRQLYNILFMTGENEFKSSEIEKIILTKENFCEKICEYYNEKIKISRMVDNIVPLAELLLEKNDSNKIIDNLCQIHKENLKHLFIWTVKKTIEHIEKNNNKDNIKYSTEDVRLLNRSRDFNKAKKSDFDIEEAKKIDQSNKCGLQFKSEKEKKFIKIK